MADCGHETRFAELKRYRSLVQWLGRVFSGSYDEAYFAETIAIGRVHVKVGLGLEATAAWIRARALRRGARFAPRVADQRAMAGQRPRIRPRPRPGSR